MTHDPMHNVEGLSGALYDGTIPCRLCEFAAKVRADTLAKCVKVLDDHHPRCTQPCDLCAEWDGMRKDLENLVGQP